MMDDVIDSFMNDEIVPRSVKMQTWAAPRAATTTGRWTMMDDRLY